jgi:hypothetical protein
VARARSLGDLCRPDFKIQGPLNARHYDGCCLVEAQTYERVATLRYMSAAVDIARLILPWAETKVRADQAGSPKAVRVLDGTDIGSSNVIGPMPGKLISSRHSRFCFTSVRTALSNAAICSRSLDHAASIGRTIGATSGRSAIRSSRRSAKERPRTDPGSMPKVLSTPRMWLDNLVTMPTS